MMQFDHSDCCVSCRKLLSAAELRSWRAEFGIDAAEVPHMRDTPQLCNECAEVEAAAARRIPSAATVLADAVRMARVVPAGRLFAMLCCGRLGSWPEVELMASLTAGGNDAGAAMVFDSLIDELVERGSVTWTDDGRCGQGGVGRSVIWAGS